MTNQRGKSRCAIRLVQTLMVLAYCAVQSAKAAPLISDTGIVQYLSQFGYLPPVNPKSEAIISEESLSNAISEFQSFVGIDVTGNIDAETIRMMTLPRCGVKDKDERSTDGRSKRYAFFDTKWQDKSLTYKISKYPTTLDSTTVDREIARALAVWSKHTDLTFTPKSGEVDIEISFEYGDHGDGSAFDGDSGVLAHAFSPGDGLGGDAHFDASEKWTINSVYGVNLFQVAAHEFGHSLGLAHSEINSALMAPYYKSYQPNLELDTDDIQGIQAIYGPKTTSRNPSIYDNPDIYEGAGNNDGQGGNDDEDRDYGGRGNDGEGSIDDEGAKDDEDRNNDEGRNDGDAGQDEGRNNDEGGYNGEGRNDDAERNDGEGGYDGINNGLDLCKDPSIDTMFIAQGYIHVFKGDNYWRLGINGIAAGYPKPIATGWKGLPSNIDAAFTDENEKTYFFKGSEYWVYANGEMDGQYPRKIRNDFPGSPDNIDAATVWNGNGQIFFYKGSKVWRFNSPQTSSVKWSYPEPISSWPGVPENLDAAFSFGGSTYFIKGGDYYRFIDRTFSMVSTRPYQTRSMLFGCPADNNQILSRYW